MTDKNTVLEKLKNHFYNAGFNLTLSIDPTQYDRLSDINKKIEDIFSGAKSLILVGFAGKNFWKIFQNYLKQNPDLKTTTSPIGNGEEITIKLR